MAALEALIGGAFARVLEAGRPRFNAAYALTKRTSPRLEPEAFGYFLRAAVAPVVEAAAGAGAEGRVGEALYDLALGLCARGAEPVGPARERWTRLLSAAAVPLAAEPAKVSRCATNALTNLDESGARSDAWVETMKALAPSCTEAGVWLEAGKVAAWRAGMAHLREGALHVLARLPAEAAALGLEAGGKRALDPARAATALAEDPWLHPATAARAGKPRRALRVTASPGGFAGFGGPFLTPPAIEAADGVLLVSDTRARWSLHADLFGAVLRRLPGEPANTKTRGGSPASAGLSADGTLALAGHKGRLPELAGALSAAKLDGTLVAACPRTYRVHVAAWVDEGP